MIMKKQRNATVPFQDWSGLMVIAAHRYCLGRQSYIVGCCIEWLGTIWDKLSDGDKYTILRDTYEALMDGYAGGKSDAQAWKGFADDMLLTLGPLPRGCLILELSNRTNRTGIMPERVVENKQP